MAAITPAIDYTDMTAGKDHSLQRVAVIAGALGLAALLAVSLSRYLFYPISYDLAVYQYITDRVAAGQSMYVDVWDQNWPGIIAVHWLANHLIGSSPLALRIFDAGWQILTLAALIALGARDGRRWATGLLAALLYAAAYFGSAYIHTAQRESFAALLLLLAVHAVLCSDESPPARPVRRFILSFLAGVFCFSAFAIKPTLGLLFGVLWTYELIESWRHRRHITGWINPAGLTGGFTLAALAAAAWLMKLGWWTGFVSVLGRAEVPGYIHSPALLRQALPYLLAAILSLGLICGMIYYWSAKCRYGGPSNRFAEVLRLWLICLAVFGLLFSLRNWYEWQQNCMRIAGLLLPACGAMLIRPWSGRSPLWRLSLLMAGAALLGMIVQGQFYFYHFFPLLAFTSYICASEIADRLSGFFAGPRSAPLWTMVCIAAAVQLGVDHWGGKMTTQSISPNVLAGTSLPDYQDQIAKHQTRYPLISTTIRAAQRVQELTCPNEPIACLLNEPRLYYYAQRPPVFRLVVPDMVYRVLFPDFMRAIQTVKPKVILARVPEDVRGSNDPSLIEAAILADTQAYFGTGAEVIRKGYRLSEVIDDVGILQPTNK